MNIHGHIGQIQQGYDVHATFNPPSVMGRIGGNLFGKTIHLNCKEERIEGRIGGNLDGFDVHLQRGITSTGHLGGDILGYSLTFTVKDKHLTGRLGTIQFGYPFQFTHHSTQLQGSIGDGPEPTPVVLTSEAQVNVQLLVVLALCAFMALADCGRAP